MTTYPAPASGEIHDRVTSPSREPLACPICERGPWESGCDCARIFDLAMREAERGALAARLPMNNSSEIAKNGVEFFAEWDAINARFQGAA